MRIGHVIIYSFEGGSPARQISMPRWSMRGANTAAHLHRPIWARLRPIRSRTSAMGSLPAERARSKAVRVGWPGSSKDEDPAKEERGNLLAVLRHFVLERRDSAEMMEKVRRHVRMCSG